MLRISATQNTFWNQRLNNMWRSSAQPTRRFSATFGLECATPVSKRHCLQAIFLGALREGFPCTMDRSLKARLGACRILLQEQAGQATHQATSRLQSAALAEQLKPLQLSAVERADLTSVVLGFPWHGNDGLHLVETIADDRSVVEAMRVKRRSMQSWCSVQNYYTQEDSTESRLLVLSHRTSRCPRRPCVRRRSRRTRSFCLAVQFAH